MQLVWFKRDLRIADHAPLARPAKAGRCVCLYVYEPELITSPEFDASHLKFINESLAELDINLRSFHSHKYKCSQVLRESTQCGSMIYQKHGSRRRGTTR